jgi:hypothetical protein
MIGIAKFSITRPDALAPYARAADLPARRTSKPWTTSANWPGGWRDDGYIPPNADTNAVAANLFSLMHGLIVMHHLVDDVPADALRNGLSLLGAAVIGPYTLSATQPQDAQP